MRRLDFNPGDPVRYIGTAKPENTGRTAKVKRPVKSRSVVTITWDDDGTLYDAIQESLEHVRSFAPIPHPGQRELEREIRELLNP